ncbi:2,4-dienoyl-CoA reductase-like NADH-dependent reductase (Old Yellow Enzyme family) [Bradyrhizobium japonicum]
MKFEALFKPLQVGPYKLAHRIALAPLTRMRAERESFSPRPLNAAYYGQRATQGGLIIAEASPVLSHGRGNPRRPASIQRRRSPAGAR